TVSNDVTNYKVFILILPDSYKDLINTGDKRRFPFRPGMTASADIQTHTKANVLAVPINAVTTREKGVDDAPSAQEEKPAEEGLQEETRQSVSADLDEIVF